MCSTFITDSKGQLVTHIDRCIILQELPKMYCIVQNFDGRVLMVLTIQMFDGWSVSYTYYALACISGCYRTA